MTEGRRYKILGAVGRGGFGTVYRAELLGEGGFSKLVALKILNADMAEVAEMARRLRDEARVLGLVRHRAIVQVDGLVKLEGRWTVVMEYVEGVDLKQLLEAARAIPLGPALEIVAEAAGALHVAYSRAGPDARPLHLLHRDIKPSNIQVTAAGETKLLDFGVARADFSAREAETRSLMFGSVGYMSPERLDFIDGPEGDIYALGCVLYEMLSGLSFGKTSSKEARHQARLAEALDVLGAEGFEGELIGFVGSMLAYEPEARPIAREVERQANALRAGRQGPSLRDWVEERVPAILATREDLQDDLSGSMLIEQGGGASGLASGSARFDEPRSGAAAIPNSGARTAPRASASRTSGAFSSTPVRTAGALVALVGLGGIGLLVLAGSAWYLSRDHTPTTSAASAPSAIAPPASVTTPTPDRAVRAEPPVEAQAHLAPRKATPASPEPARVPTRADIPAKAATQAPAKPATQAASAPAAPSAPQTGTVRVTGDARVVALVAGESRHSPGSVPPGSYTIEATFGEGSPVVAGRVQIVSGATVTLVCNAVFTRCSTQ
ncbi:MAG: serine/threonine-protein kinase [Pseudomonadota bacterium]|nr:serine/threonine-protein kinase [Pseudomonadota bacterium]